MVNPLRKPIFAGLVIALSLTSAACRPAAAPPLPALTPADAETARVDRLVARLDTEEIVPGPLGGIAPLFPGEFDRHRCPAADELAALGAEALPPLHKALDDPDPAIRRNAAFALARLGDAGAADRLYEAAESERLPPLLRISWGAIP